MRTQTRFSGSGALAAALLPAAAFAAALVSGAALAGCAEETPRLEAGSEVELCQQRLHRVYELLLEYEQRNGGAPAGSGRAFVQNLVASGVASEPGNREALLCPGRGGQEYAGRDTLRFPLERFPGPGVEPLAACPSRGGPSHANLANVLFADGSIATLELDRLIEEGSLPRDCTSVPLGREVPESARAILGGALEKLSRD